MQAFADMPPKRSSSMRAKRRRPFAVFAIVYSGPNGRARFYKMGNRTKPCGTAQRNTSAASAEVPRHPHDRDRKQAEILRDHSGLPKLLERWFHIMTPVIGLKQDLF
uniref:Uncharacterized protein n=1 Tax=Rhipicephalus zambeziensis TaxID=60191 RepID=A0A224YHD5_9ACAR